MISQPVPGYAWRAPGTPFTAAHQAVDIPAPCGTPVVAVGPGVVRSVGDDSRGPFNLDLSEWGGGLMVTVMHRAGPGGAPGGIRGDPTREVIAQYAHLSTITAGLKPGQVIGAGTRLGTVGRTGNATGCHLHFGWRVGGVWSDYREWLAGGRFAGAVLTVPPGLAPGSAGALPPDYGSGPVQDAPLAADGEPVNAFPLKPGMTCPAGYNPGTVNPQLLGGPDWWRAPRLADGTVLACIRQGLGPGDFVNDPLGDVAGFVADQLGDVARNAAFLVAFLVLGLLGLWILVRGAGSGGGGVSV